MSEEKPKLKYMNGYYIGKDYKKTFDNGDKPATKSFKYKFQMKAEEEDKELAFWGYDTTKGADTLEGKEGELFAVGYVEAENPQGDYPIKKVRFIGKPKGGVTDLNKTANSTPKTESPGDGEVKQTKWRDAKHIMEIFKKQIPEKEQTQDLFFRMCFLNEGNSDIIDRCTELENVWNAEFKKEDKELKR